MAEPKLISADSHVNEPGDLWVERIDKQFRERAPRVVENLPGQRPGAYLVLEGVTPTHLAQGMGAGKKPEELPQFFQASTYKDVRPGGSASSGSRMRRCSAPVSVSTTTGWPSTVPTRRSGLPGLG